MTLLMNLPKSLSVLTLSLLAIFTTACSTNAENDSRPNILLIQVDDFGYDDIALHGNTIIETPNLDQLASESVTFDQFYLSSVCAPSRAALLTGRNFLRTGVSGVHAGRDYVNLNETIVAEPIRDNGYRTAMWGKWHSGKTNGYLPWDRGFEEAYYSTLYNYFDNNGLMNGREVSTQGFATDALTDFAIDFLNRQEAGAPFFAYVSHMAPHNPWRAPKKDIEKYLAKGLSRPMATLYGMIDNLDRNIGRLLTALDETGLAENTVVVFLSDNGPWAYSYRFGLTDEEWKLRNPNSLRGSKGKNWQNGIRSPLFVRWKGVYESGSVSEPTIIEDLFPTLMEWTNTPIPEGIALDGRSLLPAIRGEASKPRDLFSAWASPYSSEAEYPAQDPEGNSVIITDDYRSTFKASAQRFALRSGDYKFIANENQRGAVELFNIAKDPREQHDLATSMPELVEEMKSKLSNWYERILAESHSYRMPVLQIGYDNRAFNQVYALSPTKASSDLVNHSHFLSGWSHAGQSASYAINVVTPGTYEAILMSKLAKPESFRFKISAGSSSVSQTLASDLPERPIGTLIRNESAYWEDFDLYDTFKKDIRNQNLGTLELAAGPATLQLTLEDVATGHQALEQDQVIAIQLVRVDN